MMRKLSKDEKVIIDTISQSLYGKNPEIISLGDCSKPVFRLKFDNYSKIIKMSSHIEDDELLKEIYILNKLKGRGVDIPKIEYSDSSLKIFDRLIMVMVDDGESFRNKLIKSGRNFNNNFFTYGKSLSKIHNSFSNSEIDNTDKFIPLEATMQERDNEEIKHVEKDLSFLVKKDIIDNKLADKTLKLISNMKPIGNISFCHGDFHMGQAVINDLGDITIVDWEDAHFGYSLFDYSSGYIENLVWGGSEAANLFRKGYETFSPIPKEYNEVSRIYETAGLVSVICELLQFNNPQYIKRGALILKELLS